ncbi:MAG TPA: PRC-barrel domain-containing protein [Opitutus sp.]|nr:PRC-barrel domain-containing protein [Opitutus sp.]
MKLPTTRLWVATSVAALGLWFAPGAPAAGHTSSNMPKNSHLPKNGVRAARDDVDSSARAIVGQDVNSRSGTDLGEVKNLVVETHSGKVLFATITQGGFLGMGESLHAVPYSLLEVPQQGHGTITIDTDKATLDSGPKVPEDDPAWFASHGDMIYSLFGKNLDTEAGQTSQMQHYMTVDQISGKDVRHNNEEVGAIEDVIINNSSHQGAALLDPNDDYAGTNRKFLVSFSKLSRGPGDNMSTTLTKADFSAAKPAGRDWGAATMGHPYVWGYGYAQSTGYATNRDVSGTSGTRASVSDIRQALRDDPDIGQSATQRLSFDQNNDKLTVRGTVASSDLKDKIDDKLDTAAMGWNIDNELTVASSGR